MNTYRYNPYLVGTAGQAPAAESRSDVAFMILHLQNYPEHYKPRLSGVTVAPSVRAIEMQGHGVQLKVEQEFSRSASVSANSLEDLEKVVDFKRSIFYKISAVNSISVPIHTKSSSQGALTQNTSHLWISRPTQLPERLYSVLPVPVSAQYVLRTTMHALHRQTWCNTAALLIPLWQIATQIIVLHCVYLDSFRMRSE